MRTLAAFAIAAATVVAVVLAAVPAASAESVGWVRVYDGRAHGGAAFTSVVATRGAVYAAGYTANGTMRRSDMLLARYATDGSRAWVRCWNGPLSGSDQSWDLARDRRGGLCLVGRTAGHGGDAAIVRYTSGGRLVWSRRYNTGSGWQDDARFVRKLSGRDGIYVVVESWSGTAYRTRILRFSLKGVRVWTAALARGTRVRDVVTDAADNLYLTGWVETTAGSAAVLDSFDRSGSRRWSVRLDGDAPYSRAAAVADRTGGIVWVMDGSAADGGPESGSVIASPHTPFAQLWIAGLGAASPNRLNDLGSTPSGGVVTVGALRPDGPDDGIVLQLDATGVPVAPPATWSDAAGCSGDLVAPASDLSSWVAGKTGAVFSVLHFVPGSGLVWRYDHTARPAGRALALTAAADGGAYVAGWSRPTGTGAGATLVRVSP